MVDDRNRKVDVEQVARVFRGLSREHIATKRRDDRDAIWATLTARRRGLVSQHERRWAGLRPSKPSRSPRAAAIGAVAAAAFVAVATIGIALWPASSLTYVVSSEEGPTVSVEGAEASESRQLVTEELETTVVFSDDSKITLRPHTALRLRVQEEGQVRASLVRGTIRVHVEHRERTDYRFRAGPYEVRVIGTTFALGYEPAALRMKLDVVEGRVLVADEAGRQREAVGGIRLELPEGADPTEKPAAPASDEAARSLEEETAAREPRAAPVRKAPDRGAPVDFLALARSGRYDAVVRAAEREGVERVLSSRSPAELQEIAHAARYTGRTSFAIRVYDELSLRHGASAPGRRAPFFLGRIAEESGQLGRALILYGDYLDRSPAGVYAAEALGRKMALVQRRQGAQAARPIALEYVRRFPDGSYHTLARSLLAGARSRVE